MEALTSYCGGPLGDVPCGRLPADMPSSSLTLQTSPPHPAPPAPWVPALNNLDGQVFPYQGAAHTALTIVKARRALPPLNMAQAPLLHPPKHT